MKRPIQLNRFLALILQRNVSTKEAEQEVRTTRVANLATFARKKHGLTLPCVPKEFTDIDGCKYWYGVYSPTPNDKEIIREVLRKSSEVKA
ncbi:hypothetical protein [Marinospirillum insulare]|uniref:Uncharacterized protein n=1 Tax=Marinospirillum insulare TaxID=217169 RepID=A0ABQ5ZXJ9_9GAMM|nr:hypothetical protein [Marinospirillum insulare]GLR63750.1 hypothetical protein GCM10007878_11850 [Marinospirillum insulare]